VDELLAHGADPNQALTHGLGNALCVATLPVCEANRSLPARIALVCSLSTAWPILNMFIYHYEIDNAVKRLTIMDNTFVIEPYQLHLTIYHHSVT